MKNLALLSLLSMLGACGTTSGEEPAAGPARDAGAPRGRDAAPAARPDAASPTPTPDAGTPAPDAAPAAPDGPGVPAVDYCNATDPRQPAPLVFATPEAGERPYLEVLERATRSVRVQVYLMGTGGILTALKAKAQAGVRVQVILDGEQGRDTNQRYFDQLAAAGVEVLWSDPQFSYMHAKFIVVDEREALVSTGNYSAQYSINLERNFVAQLSDPADVADLVALFDADWSRASPDMRCTRLVVSPINSKDRILALINSAQRTLQIESMQFADRDVRAAVQARKQAGVEVRALLADAGWITANADAATFLKGLGVPVKHIPHLHTKVLIVDGARAYFGSENLSVTSLTRNREVGLIVTEASSVAPLLATFERDWTAGVDF